jgi:hypothetical protein
MESKLPLRYEFRRKAVGSRQTFTAMDVDDDLVSEFSDGGVIDSLRENNGLVSIETGLELKSPADLTGTLTSFPFSRTRTVFPNGSLLYRINASLRRNYPLERWARRGYTLFYLPAPP